MSEKEVFGTMGYAQQAAVLFDQYKKFAAEDSFDAVAEFFPAAAADILDVGAGTGQHAYWFASLGHHVLAVEPVREFREPASKVHQHDHLEFLDDSLPYLANVLEQGQQFDLIIANAVWMHLDEERRRIGMSTLASLLKPKGKIFLSLRHGPVPDGRQMFEVSGQETIDLAAENNLSLRHHSQNDSIQKQNRKMGVMWTKLVFEKNG
ncbi:class I SAM-dependent methyltransferase [Parasphingorhabdus sp.]|uniref:class I SAM-dependent methyltransferase n=1 Tax=Parasphingorhabdus sp. TaxID=2709688 RepID=UPI003265CEED